VFVDHEVNTDARCVRLFAGLRQKDDVAVEGDAMTFQQQHHH
jgi:hypothetical protein